MSDITQAQADAVLGAARESARETGTAMNIAVVDVGGNLKAFTRMDGAWLGSIDISIKKARTARYFDMATGSIGELSQPGPAVQHRSLQRRTHHVPRRTAAAR
nr:heme-binding protein [Arthrobacter sp. KBS0703]